MQKAVDAIKNSTARLVLYASDIDLNPFALEMFHHNITDRTWIASEAWITSALITKPEYFPYFGGSIGFAIPRTDIPGLKEFLYDVHPSKDPNDVLTVEFWQTAFNCTWLNSTVPSSIDHRVNVTGKDDRFMPCLINSVLESRSWKILKIRIWMCLLGVSKNHKQCQTSCVFNGLCLGWSK